MYNHARCSNTQLSCGGRVTNKGSPTMLHQHPQPNNVASTSPAVLDATATIQVGIQLCWHGCSAMFSARSSNTNAPPHCMPSSQPAQQLGPHTAAGLGCIAALLNAMSEASQLTAAPCNCCLHQHPGRTPATAQVRLDLSAWSSLWLAQHLQGRCSCFLHSRTAAALQLPQRCQAAWFSYDGCRAVWRGTR